MDRIKKDSKIIIDWVIPGVLIFAMLLLGAYLLAMAI